jgi:hypothetical protein
MNQTNHFFNLGYGWLCKHCSAADAETKQSPQARGSSSAGAQAAPALALASWTDASHHALTCPRCGIEETISSS